MSDPRGPIDESFLIGGREHRDIVVVDYDHRRPDRFVQERARIHTALGAVAQQVEHVGSTAVPGLLAKPIIDVLVTLTDVEDEARYLPNLIEAGYLLRVREPGHRMLRTTDLDVHVHVWPKGAAAVKATLACRGRLRADVADRDLYAATKQELARRDWPTMNHYAVVPGKKSSVDTSVPIRGSVTGQDRHSGAAGSRAQGRCANRATRR